MCIRDRRDNAYLSNNTGGPPFPAPAAGFMQQQLDINAAQRTMGAFGQISYCLLYTSSRTKHIWFSNIGAQFAREGASRSALRPPLS